jgi:phenylacetate 2-hydroxylase
MTFNPSRYMASSGLPEATRSLPNYTFSLGRRNCPAMLLAHKEMYNIISALVQWFETELHDGEMEFDPVEANDSPYQFNQGPKQFRVLIRARDQAKLEEWLSTGDGDEVEEVLQFAT